MKTNENNNRERKPGFGLPGDYFSHSAQSIMNRIAWETEHEEFPGLRSLKGTTGFVLPENYFVQMSDRTELLAFESLQGLKKSGTGMGVPENYFTENAGEFERLLTQKESRIISLRVLRRVTYLAAAILILSAGIWIFKGTIVEKPEVDCGTIACLDKKEIIESKSLESLDDEYLYELADPESIERNMGGEDERPGGDSSDQGRVGS
jgi:hypothetical protein